MSKWIAKFLAVHPGSLPDTPDTLEPPPSKTVLRCRNAIALTLDGETIPFEPSDVFTVPEGEAQRLMKQHPEQLERVSLPPSTARPQPIRPVEPPLQPGWIVAYRDWENGLCGGWEAADKGVVSSCQWDGHGWMVTVVSGERFPLRAVVSVGKVVDGRLVAAWTTREHGYDGERPPRGGALQNKDECDSRLVRNEDAKISEQDGGIHD